MKLSQVTIIIVFVKIGLFYVHPISAQETKLTLDGLWGNFKSESENLLNKSIKVTSDFANELGNLIDDEIGNLKELQVETSEVDIRDKIDTVYMLKIFQN